MLDPLRTGGGVTGWGESHFHHVGVHPCLEVGHQPGSRLEHDHHLVTVQHRPVDTGQHSSQFGTGRHLRQPFG